MGVSQEVLDLRNSKQPTDREKCISLLQEYLKNQPDDAQAYYYLASCQDFLGQESDAKKNYDRVYELGLAKLPVNEQRSFYVGFGSTLRNTGSLYFSQRILEEGLRQFPSYAPLLIFLSLTFHSQGRHELAMKTVFRSLTLLPDDGFDGYQSAIKSYSKLLLAD